LQHIKDSKKTFFLFDEIQIVQSWEKTVNSLQLNSDVQIYLTGSNAQLLSSELATLLGGRYVSIFMVPLSYKESKQFDPNLSFDEYIEFGGFPGVLTLSDRNQKFTYLNDVVNSIVFKDIILRNDLNDPVLLKKLCSFVFDTTGTLLSVRNITNRLLSNNINARQETISRYLELLKDAFIIYETKRYDIKGKNILTRNPKYYGVDTGIRSILTSPNSRNLGSVLENIVYLELLRRGFKIYVGLFNSLEVDFIVTKNNTTIYIQVILSALSEETANREFRSLMQIPNNFRKYLISADTINLSRDGITHLNIEDFLLDENSI
jgi:predicted AAA+ superfamily ATPase